MRYGEEKGLNMVPVDTQRPSERADITGLQYPLWGGKRARYGTGGHTKTQ